MDEVFKIAEKINYPERVKVNNQFQYIWNAFDAHQNNNILTLVLSESSNADDLFIKYVIDRTAYYSLLNFKVNGELTALHLAAMYNRVYPVITILNRPDLNDKEKFSLVNSYSLKDKDICDTPLFIAARYGALDVFRVFVNSEIPDLKFVNKNGDNILHAIADSRGKKGWFKNLLSCNLEHLDIKGLTDKDIQNFLNTMNKNNKTPYDIAVGNQNITEKDRRFFKPSSQNDQSSSNVKTNHISKRARNDDDDNTPKKLSKAASKKRVGEKSSSKKILDDTTQVSPRVDRRSKSQEGLDDSIELNTTQVTRGRGRPRSNQQEPIQLDDSIELNTTKVASKRGRRSKSQEGLDDSIELNTTKLASKQDRRSKSQEGLDDDSIELSTTQVTRGRGRPKSNQQEPIQFQSEEANPNDARDNDVTNRQISDNSTRSTSSVRPFVTPTTESDNTNDLIKYLTENEYSKGVIAFCNDRKAFISRGISGMKKVLKIASEHGDAFKEISKEFADWANGKNIDLVLGYAELDQLIEHFTR